MECVATSEGKDGDHTLYADRAEREGLKATGCAVMLRHYGNVTVRGELCDRMEMSLNAAGEAYEVTDAADMTDGGTVYRYERTK